MNGKRGHDSADQLTNWGDSMMNKLPSLTRKRRKRDASKKRRSNEKQELRREKKS
jgi:hypothetical protein